MSRLREQLRAAKDDYGRARYAGDLRTEVLGYRTPRLPRNRWLLRIGFGGGGALAAAAVGLVVVFSRPLPVPPGRPPAVPSQRAGRAAVASTGRAGQRPLALAPPAIPELPAMPDWSSVPALPALPAMPVMGPPAALPVNPTDRMNRSIVPDLSAMASPGWFGFPSAPAAAAPPARSGRGNATTKESI